MLESVLSGFTDISLLELILIAGMALIASVVGGVAGYGTSGAGRADPLFIGAVHKYQSRGGVLASH